DANWPRPHRARDAVPHDRESWRRNDRGHLHEDYAIRPAGDRRVTDIRHQLLNWSCRTRGTTNSFGQSAFAPSAASGSRPIFPFLWPTRPWRDSPQCAQPPWPQPACRNALPFVESDFEFRPKIQLPLGGDIPLLVRGNVLLDSMHHLTWCTSSAKR